MSSGKGVRVERGYRSLGLLLGLLATATACRVPRPTVREFVANTDVVGFRDPRQTFETFRMALRENLPALEYRSFSTGFRDRHQGLSQIGYREFRDELLDSTPLLRWAISKAEVREVEMLGERRARLLACVRGRTLLVDFVREDFWELWSGRDLLADDLVDDLARGSADAVARAVSDQGELLFIGQVRLDERGIDPSQITEFRLGQEWKIDDFRVFDDPPCPEPDPAPDP